MMPGIGLHRGALDIPPQSNNRAIEQLLHNHDHNENKKGESFRGVMRLEDLVSAPHRQTKGGRDHA